MPGTDASARPRVHNAFLDIAATVVLVVLALAALGGVLDPTLDLDRPDWWPGVIFVAVPLLVAIRGAVVGVVVIESYVVVRGWLRTRRVPRDQIVAVTTRPYSGLWNRGSESRHFSMLALTTTSRSVDVPAVAANRAKAERLALEVRRALMIAE